MGVFESLSLCPRGFSAQERVAVPSGSGCFTSLVRRQLQNPRDPVTLCESFLPVRGLEPAALPASGTSEGGP